MDGGEEVACGLVIAGGNGTKELEFGEEVFNQVAAFVKFLVVIPLHFAVGLGRNHRRLARLLQGDQHARIGIEAFVGEHSVGLKFRQQRIGAFQVAGLPTGEMKSSGVAEGVDGGVNLGAQPALAAPDGLVGTPFFSAPALC